jgi:hypothetical protein
VTTGSAKVIDLMDVDGYRTDINPASSPRGWTIGIGSPCGATFFRAWSIKSRKS